jgi:hypothetical protein
MSARLLTAGEESPEKKGIQSDSCNLLAENAKTRLGILG